MGTMPDRDCYRRIKGEAAKVVSMEEACLHLQGKAGRDMLDITQGIGIPEETVGGQGVKGDSGGGKVSWELGNLLILMAVDVLAGMGA